MGFEKVIGKKLNKTAMKDILAEMNKHLSWGNKAAYYEFAMIQAIPFMDKIPDEDVGKINQEYDIRTVNSGEITAGDYRNEIPPLCGNELVDVYVFGRDGNDLGDLIDNIIIKIKNFVIVSVNQTVTPRTFFKE